MQAAMSPTEKQRVVSGYPSPPSSGRREEEVLPRVQGTLAATTTSIGVRETGSLSPSETFDGDGGELEGGASTVDMARSRSCSSWSDTLVVSSPSTSGGALAEHGREPLCSPYLHLNHLEGPIRDTPRNPFLEGGPADVGLTGPSGRTKKRSAGLPPRERGRMTYVFRGQRVTYADPYASDSDDEGCSGPSSRGCMMDRLQPRILFPSAGRASSRLTSVAKTATTAIASPVPATRPLLDMAVERQSAPRAANATSRELLARLDQAGWSDDEDEDDDGEHSTVQDCDYNCDVDVDDCADENPFLQPASNKTSASFLQRLQQTRPGAVRSHHGDHRYKPYSSQPRGHAHSLAHSMHIPDHLKGRAR